MSIIESLCVGLVVGCGLMLALRWFQARRRRGVRSGLDPPGRPTSTSEPWPGCTRWSAGLLVRLGSRSGWARSWSPLHETKS